MKTTESFILEHTQCPECKKQGRDNSANNLGVYSDGHTFCFSCGYHTAGDAIIQYKNRHLEVQEVYTGPVLPYDVTTEIPREPLEWFCSHGLDTNTLQKHNIMWSESRQMLVFPYFIEGELLGWQGRVFGEQSTRRKWFTQGRVDDFIYTLGVNLGVLVLVESIVSAIKVSRVCASSPIFGSHISNERLLRINKFYDKIIIWLDPDKRTVALRAAQKARLFGLEAHVVLSDMKPKDYTIEEIERFVNDSS